MKGQEIIKDDDLTLTLQPHESSHLIYFGKNDRFEVKGELGESSSLVLEIVNLNKDNKEVNYKGSFKQDPSSKVKIVMVDFSPCNIKSDFVTDLDDGAEFYADLASVAKNRENKEFGFTVNHNKPNGKSLVKMFGVLKDSASLAFEGASNIKRGAKKTVTREEGHIADLSDDGKADVSPILRIDEDDVKASHAAALGKIPEDSLFYMMSRGLTKEEAAGLITIGFLKPIVSEISDEKTRDALIKYVESRQF